MGSSQKAAFLLAGWGQRYYNEKRNRRRLLDGNCESKMAFDVLGHHEMTHLYHTQVNPEMRKMVAGRD
jgi:hypothetical protein